MSRIQTNLYNLDKDWQEGGRFFHILNWHFRLFTIPGLASAYHTSVQILSLADSCSFAERIDRQVNMSSAGDFEAQVVVNGEEFFFSDSCLDAFLIISIL